MLLFPSAGIDRYYGSNVWQGICDHKKKFATTMVYLLIPALDFTDVGPCTKGLTRRYRGFGAGNVTGDYVPGRRWEGSSSLSRSASWVLFIKVQARFTNKERMWWMFTRSRRLLVSFRWVAFTYYAQIAVLLGNNPHAYLEDGRL